MFLLTFPFRISVLFCLWNGFTFPAVIFKGEDFFLKWFNSLLKTREQTFPPSSLNICKIFLCFFKMYADLFKVKWTSCQRYSLGLSFSSTGHQLWKVIIKEDNIPFFQFWGKVGQALAKASLDLKLQNYLLP